MLIAMFIIGLIVLICGLLSIMGIITQTFDLIDVAVFATAGAGLVLAVLSVINFAVAS